MLLSTQKPAHFCVFQRNVSFPNMSPLDRSNEGYSWDRHRARQYSTLCDPCRRSTRKGCRPFVWFSIQLHVSTTVRCYSVPGAECRYSDGKRGVFSPHDKEQIGYPLDKFTPRVVHKGERPKPKHDFEMYLYVVSLHKKLFVLSRRRYGIPNGGA